jgi:DNA-binding MarR family transcriptional regulator
MANASPEERINQTLMRIARWLTRPETRTRLLGDAGHELTPVDVDLLRTIVADGPIRVSDLAERQSVDKSTVTPQVRRLERRDLIGRQPDPSDRRAVSLTATARGRRACQRMDLNSAAVITNALHNWSEKDRKALATLLARFADDITNPPAASPQS